MKDASSRALELGTAFHVGDARVGDDPSGDDDGIGVERRGAPVRRALDAPPRCAIAGATDAPHVPTALHRKVEPPSVLAQIVEECGARNEEGNFAGLIDDVHLSPGSADMCLPVCSVRLS